MNIKTKRTTFSVNEDSRELVFEEFYNERNSLIRSIDYNEKTPIERNFEYNSLGQLVWQNEIQDGIENSLQRYEYNKEGEVIDEKLFIGGTLYEHIQIEKSDSGFIRTMKQDNLEIERMEKIIDGKNWNNKFYHQNELLESQTYTYNEEENIGEKITQSFENGLIIRAVEKYNDQNEMISKEEFNENGALRYSIKITMENGLKLKESVKDFLNDEEYYELIYEYDDNKNLINFEERTPSASLKSFHKRKFDDQNRLIEEKGCFNGFFSGVTGIHENYDFFHLVHEYEVFNG